MTTGESTEPITVTIPEAIRRSGIGRTKLYELISSKEIESVCIGTRRLINFESLKKRLTPKPATADTQQSRS